MPRAQAFPRPRSVCRRRCDRPGRRGRVRLAAVVGPFGGHRDRPGRHPRRRPACVQRADMHCAVACAPKVQQTLAKQSGVEKVETDATAHTATVKVGTGYDEVAALKALEAAGYPATRI